jgi:hypothetical protein
MGLAGAAPLTEVVKGGRNGLLLRSEGAVNSTMPMGGSSGSRFLLLRWSEGFEQSAEHSLWQLP